MKFTKELLDLFSEDWKCSAKVVQKDADFMFKRNPTGAIGIGEDIYLNINCGDWFKYGIDYYKTEVTNDQTFMERFDELCKKVISKDFQMFHDPDTTYENWLQEFVDEQHGSGVSALFWMYYQMRANIDVKNIVIDNLDGFLHHLSMEQLGRIFKELKGYKIIFLMNNDTLFTHWIFDTEDLYVLHGDRIANVRQCTDRELRPEHNMQNLLRAGEFETIYD